MVKKNQNIKQKECYEKLNKKFKNATHKNNLKQTITITTNRNSIINTHTHRNPNTTLKLTNKSEEKRTKQENRKGRKKDLQKQIQNNQQNGNTNIH